MKRKYKTYKHCCRLIWHHFTHLIKAKMPYNAKFIYLVTISLFLANFSYSELTIDVPIENVTGKLNLITR